MYTILAFIIGNYIELLVFWIQHFCIVPLLSVLQLDVAQKSEMYIV